jgi:hypothetical protein
MPTKQARRTQTYPQSVGNVALADDSLGLLQESTAGTRPRLQAVGQATIEEVANSDALAPAIGMTVGLVLSIMLWGLIILALYWIR